MNYKLYSIHDSAVSDFGPPMQCRTHGEAERTFRDLIADERTGNIHKHPEHFTLFYVGDFDSSAGKILAQEAAMCIITGIQAKANDQG
jgi:hypothetical protein